MTDQPRTVEDVKAIVEEHQLRFIRFWFTDILGQLKSFSINSAELDDAFENGMGFDGSSITGFNAIEESDMIAMPDPTTFAILPWRPEEQGVGRVFCDITTPERTPYEGDPRHVLRRALERMEQMGFDKFNVGPELEYFLFKDKNGTEVLDEGGYFDLTTLDAGSDVRRETVIALEQLGIHVEYSHHEVGPSQHEVDMRYADAMKMADDCMTYRITVKEYAMKYGWHATFMPKPLFGENGSGMHTHMSLFKDGRNAMFDADDPYFLSDIGKAFIAGQLKHARELSSIFAQWVNSYKRLVPGFEAPVYVAWSRRNRSALVRVPLYHPGKEQGTRMELRCPDPACNPYLTFAALLQAGLEGIEKGYELPEPMEKNLYHQSLFRAGQNAFYDPDDQYFLSDVGKAFIAGQLKHAREICSIFAQWVNSYKRLVPGFEAPVYVAWSRRNRSALVRVPLYHPGSEKATRMELRCPDPACNPYLTFAVLLQAGLEGI
ncbi:MAG: glutamine synthetase, partial [Ramlibacter sp.]|nr:glutamine synthetase [Ramlibacter sp.]